MGGGDGLEAQIRGGRLGGEGKGRRDDGRTKEISGKTIETV